MMLTKNPESVNQLFPSQSKSKSKKSKSTKSVSSLVEKKEEVAIDHQRGMMMMFAIVVIIAVGLLLYFFVIAKKKKSKTSSSVVTVTTSNFPSIPFVSLPVSTLDNPSSVARFKHLRNIWFRISQDNTFLLLAKTLMDVNNSALNSKDGNHNIFIAYENVNTYVKTKMNLRGARITLIYLDGIVFYDSALDLAKTYFMNDGLPRPVSISTLGSPLKDHNTLPENFNSLMVHPRKFEDMVFMGMSVTDPLYKDLFHQGFGFIERISSSMSIPYTYLSRFLTFSTDPITSFPNGCTLSVSMPIGLM